VEKVRLEIEFVTPCFLGGADAGEAPALEEWDSTEGRWPDRPIHWQAKPIRGQLRWWFRAIAGGIFKGDTAAVTAAEKRIFGSTECQSPLRVRALGNPGSSNSKDNFGKSLYHDQIAQRWKASPAVMKQVLQLNFPTSPVGYLAFGLLGLKNPNANDDAPKYLRYWNRQYFECNETAEIELRLANGTALPPRELACMQWTLWAWLNLGGLGGRSRRGLGSLACKGTPELAPWLTPDNQVSEVLTAPLAPKSLDVFEAQIHELLQLGARTEKGTWTHLSRTSRVFIGKTGYSSSTSALEYLGSWLIAFRRRYGLPDLDPRPATKFSRADRDYKWIFRDSAPGHIPDRAGFGMPLSFGRHDIVTWRKGSGSAATETNRRASPLLLHVQKIPNQKSGAAKYYPVLTHLPAQLIPDDAEMKSPNAKVLGVSSAQEEIVGDFLQDLEDKNLVRRVL